MLADLDLLCIAIFCAADDFLPKPAENARRKLSDAEVVTLCVAQVLLGIPSDRRFLAAAAHRLSHLFPLLPTQDAFHKRRARLADGTLMVSVLSTVGTPPWQRVRRPRNSRTAISGPLLVISPEASLSAVTVDRFSGGPL
jgi:hypothetical protein